MALRFLERELRRLLVDTGHQSLTDAAVGAITFTDDGGTIYVHLLPKESWPHRAQDKASRMHCYRWLVKEARASLRENVDAIARWLEGR